MPDAPVMVRHTHLETFIVATLMAMKMPRAPAEITAGLMVRTDLRGVDSHGIGMLPRYVEWWREGIWCSTPSPGSSGTTAPWRCSTPASVSATTRPLALAARRLARARRAQGLRPRRDGGHSLGRVLGVAPLVR